MFWVLGTAFRIKVCGMLVWECDRVCDLWKCSGGLGVKWLLSRILKGFLEFGVG